MERIATFPTVVPSHDVAVLCADILASRTFAREKDAIQHGTITVFEHSLSVANACAAAGRMLPLRLKMRPLVRAALLHDYFLYDWHDRAAAMPNHATRHGSYARANAERDFNITAHEGDIIQSHMFPLEGFPRTREAWVLTCVDKCIALKEAVMGMFAKLKVGRG